MYKISTRVEMVEICLSSVKHGNLYSNYDGRLYNCVKRSEPGGKPRPSDGYGQATYGRIGSQHELDSMKDSSGIPPP